MLVVLQGGHTIAEHVGAAPEQVLRPWLETAVPRCVDVCSGNEPGRARQRFTS